MASLDQRTYSPGVQISEGTGGLSKISLSSQLGSEAEIYLFGACVTSWKVSNGRDLLFVRPDAVFDGKKPISGGIPHCFPQFGPGPMQQHGFARNMSWSIADSDNVEGDPVITLELKDDLYSRSMWDFSFQALYKEKVGEMMTENELQHTLISTHNNEGGSEEESQYAAMMDSRQIYTQRRPFAEMERRAINYLILSIDQPPELELKQLPSHLKYAFLLSPSHLPVIIFSLLTNPMEEKLLRVLRVHKRAIGWTIADIYGISPTICIHKILMEEQFKPSVQP